MPFRSLLNLKYNISILFIILNIIRNEKLLTANSPLVKSKNLLGGGEQKGVVKIKLLVKENLNIPSQFKGRGLGWGGKFSKNLFRIYHNKKSKTIYTSPSVPLLEGRGKIVSSFASFFS